MEWAVWTYTDVLLPTSSSWPLMTAPFILSHKHTLTNMMPSMEWYQIFHAWKYECLEMKTNENEWTANRTELRTFIHILYWSQKAGGESMTVHCSSMGDVTAVLHIWWKMRKDCCVQLCEYLQVIWTSSAAVQKKSCILADITLVNMRCSTQHQVARSAVFAQDLTAALRGNSQPVFFFNIMQRCRCK